MRFVVITDTHFFAEGRGKDGVYWNKTLHSRSAEIGVAMFESIAKLRPEFVIHCGDFTGLCDMENFEMGRQIMDRLCCPWFVVPGNHDTWYPGVRDRLSDFYGLPRGQCYYYFSLDDTCFVFLDTCYWQARDGSVSPYLDKQSYDCGMIEGLVVPQDEIAWLRNVLARHGNQKVILVGHAPIGFKPRYPVRDMPEGLINHDEMRALISEYKNVKVVFAGHWHINDIHLEDGVVFCQTCSLREYPFEFRFVEARADGLHISTVGLEDSSFNCASLIPEKDNTWVAGNDADREWLVPWQR
ncbi:MAG TPA: metallophosphoesterase [Candidatus Dormibacteraeota bacterium]|nr:metallophosphoesterase [Candidatus Dormibacteraeota bacterium]